MHDKKDFSEQDWENAFAKIRNAGFDAVLSNLLDDPQLLSTSGDSARKLVLDNLGATEQILDLTLDPPKST